MNGVRPGVLALFFLFGMAFTAVLFFMVFPDVLSPQPAKTLLVPTPSLTFGHNPDAQEPAPPLTQEEPPPRPAEPKRIATAPKLAVTKPVEIPQPPRDEMIEPDAAGAQTQTTSPKISIPPPTASAVVHRASRGRQIFGHVSIVGSIPAEKPLPLDPACGKLQTQTPTTRFFVVDDDGSLADVVVQVTAGLPHRRWAAVEKPLSIAIRNCVFEPYVAAIQRGQSIHFQNLDPELHNVHLTPGPGSRYGDANFALFHDRPPQPLNFPFPEDFLRLKCDIHAWMFFYVTVVDHPFFAVTGRDGRFVLSDLPSGKFTITATHRKAGTLKAEATIGDDWSKEIEFKFDAPTNLAGPG